MCESGYKDSYIQAIKIECMKFKSTFCNKLKDNNIFRMGPSIGQYAFLNFNMFLKLD